MEGTAIMASATLHVTPAPVLVALAGIQLPGTEAPLRLTYVPQFDGYAAAYDTQRMTRLRAIDWLKVALRTSNLRVLNALAGGAS